MHIFSKRFEIFQNILQRFVQKWMLNRMVYYMNETDNTQKNQGLASTPPWLSTSHKYVGSRRVNKSGRLKWIHSVTYRAILVVLLPQRDGREAQQLAFSMHVLHVHYDRRACWKQAPCWSFPVYKVYTKMLLWRVIFCLRVEAYRPVKTKTVYCKLYNCTSRSRIVV